MSDTPRTDALEAKMTAEGLERTFRTDYLFATFREWERGNAAIREALETVEPYADSCLLPWVAKIVHEALAKSPPAQGTAQP